MFKIKDIKKPIKKEMSLFEDKFKSSLKTSVPLLDKIMHYIIKRKGKQMRPMLIFLCSKLLSNGNVNDKVYRGASVIELIHTATLIHDDVVDDSKRRRGFFSINAIWKNKIAVLVGDFLLSKGMLLCIENKDFDLLEIISESVKNMSEGELLQIEKAKKLDIEEDIYFEIISKKTASLISSCCKIAASGIGSLEKEKKMIGELGVSIGIAFQIKDDLFDYGKQKIGKPRGIDIKEKKMTLPLIKSLENASAKDKKWIINSIKKFSNDKKVVRQIIDYVKNNGGLDYAISMMNEYHTRSLKILDKFPDNQFKVALKNMIDYVIERDY